MDRVERRFDLRSGLVVSLAAKYHLPAISLGLDVPQALLAIADRVDRMNFPCPPLAQLGHAAVVALCPLLGAERKTCARVELFRF